MLKLNLGCGNNLLPMKDGWLNVDKFAPTAPQAEVFDFKNFDLETFPWPWSDDSVDEINMTHVLEHLGQDPKVFLQIVTEVYRVCRHGAHWIVTVPHPRHDHFIIDPTHVRPIMPEFFPMLSRKVNQKWIDDGYSSTPLAMQNNVDFDLEKCEVTGDKVCRERIEREITQMFGEFESPVVMENLMIARMRILEKREINVVQEFKITLRVIK